MIKPLTALTHTENLALAYSTTSDARLDFFYSILPTTPKEKVFLMAENCWKVDKLDTLKIIFHLGSVRFGKSDSKHFQVALYWLYQNHPKTLLANLPVVAETSYWKHLLLLLEDIHEEPQVKKMLPTNRVKLQRRNGVTSLGNPGRETPANEIPYTRLPDQEEKGKGKERMLEENRIRQEEAKKKRKEKEEIRAQKLQKLLSQSDYTSIRNQIISLFVEALKSDIEKMRKKEKIGLVAKWAPSHGKSADQKTSIGLSIGMSFLVRKFKTYSI